MKRLMILAVVSPFVWLALTAAAFAAGGLAVDDVVVGGPSARAGMKAGDRIVEMDGRTIAVLPDLEAVLKARAPGDNIPVVVDRGGRRVPLSVTLGERAPGVPSLGVMLGLVPDDMADRSKAVGADYRRAVLGEIAEALRDGYLYEDKGRTFAKKLERSAKADRFAEKETLGEFVSALNGYLLEISNDRHLRVGYGPPMDGGPRRVIRRGPGPGDGAPTPDGGHGAPQRVVRRGGPGDGPDDHGVREAKVLDGNIGYLDLRMFAGSEAAKPAIDEAMTELAGVDALILDLGRNGGGGPWMVRYLSGFLFKEPTHLTDTWARGMEEPRQRWTLEGQPTDAFVDVPVFILTSNRTFSAAESCTFGLKINDRVTLVGERTGGGGHFGDEALLNEELRLFVPGGRTYDPDTGKGWEAEGIEPDIAVPYAEALERARREAGQAVAAGR